LQGGPAQKNSLRIPLPGKKFKRILEILPRKKTSSGGEKAGGGLAWENVDEANNAPDRGEKNRRLKKIYNEKEDSVRSGGFDRGEKVYRIPARNVLLKRKIPRDDDHVGLGEGKENNRGYYSKENVEAGGAFAVTSTRRNTWEKAES